MSEARLPAVPAPIAFPPGLKSSGWACRSLVLLPTTRQEVQEPELEEVRAPAETVIDLPDRKVVVADPAMSEVYRRLQQLGACDLVVLILGETGAGKEVATAALRHWSRRREQPFVTVNCAALPDNLVESELFGYEAGAFSGAAKAKAGLLESAAGGTLFLDEIGDLSLQAQAKILRVLETRKVTRLGSVRERAVDVRIVAATHRELAQEVAAGRFRQDLYYRLSVGVVRLPPLRERSGEVALLARHFLHEACQAFGRAPLAIGAAAMARLAAHAWPGNVRELKNLMECLAAVVTEPELGPEHITFQATCLPVSAEVSPPPLVVVDTPPPPAIPVMSLAEAAREFERGQIEAALAATNGNKTLAAKLLQVPLRTFMTKVRRLEVSVKRA